MSNGGAARAGSLAVAFALLALFCGLAGCGDESPTVLRVADDAPRGSVLELSLQGFAAQVGAESGGRLRVELVRLGEGRPAAGVLDGSMDLAAVPAATLAVRGVPGFEILQLPFLIDDDRLLSRVLLGPIGRDLLPGVRGSDNLEALGFIGNGIRRPASWGTPPTRPDQLRGARMPAGPDLREAAGVRSLGAVPVAVAADRTFAARRAGRIDVAALSVADAARTDTGMVKALTIGVGLWPSLFVLVAGGTTFDALREDDRSALRRAAQAMSERSLALAEDADTQALATACAAGVRVAVAGPRARLAFRRAVAPAWRRAAEEPGAALVIAQIERLRRDIGDRTPPRLPRGCRQE